MQISFKTNIQKYLKVLISAILLHLYNCLIHLHFPLLQTIRVRLLYNLLPKYFRPTWWAIINHNKNLNVTERRFFDCQPRSHITCLSILLFIFLSQRLNLKSLTLIKIWPLITNKLNLEQLIGPHLMLICSSSFWNFIKATVTSTLVENLKSIKNKCN